MKPMAWPVLLHPGVEAWFLGFCRDDPISPMGSRTDGLSDAIDQLVELGPGLGRPLVDRIQGSQFHNMKELRSPSTGSSEVRMLLAFDPAREPSFLVAGDKAGNWNR